MSRTLKKLAFFSKNLLFRPRSIRFARRFACESQLEEPERQALILSRLRDIVKCAWDNSPYYREKYRDVGLSDGIINSFAEFELLPPLEKSEIREHGDLILNQNFPKRLLKESSTGGSTGIPVKVFHDRSIPLDTVGWYVLRQFGGDISDNAAFLERYNPHRQKFPVNKLMWLPTRRCFLDVSNITNERWHDFYRRCRGISPVYIQGYVGAVEEFAEFLSRNSLSLPSLRFVWTTAAPLTDASRLRMELIFKCPVYSQYGCCECYWLASECRQKQMHYFDTIRHFEILDENNRPLPDGETGDLAITDLLNHAFPLIRYRNGDRLKKLPGNCSCGSRLPLLGKINGRTTDIIRLPGGGCVPGDFLTTIFDHAPEAVNRLQVVQHKDHSITIRYVPASTGSEAAVAEVCAGLGKQFGGIKVSAEAVDEIPSDRGKIRFVVSEFK